MSDDCSHHSSTLGDPEKDRVGGDSDYDGSFVMSEDSDISATRVATHPEYAAIWELVHACQEAAFSDIPEKYRDCLSIFDTKHSGQGSAPTAPQRDGHDVRYDELFKAAGATDTSAEPWSLAAVTRPLSKEDALWPPNVRVLNVSEVIPTAAVYLTPDAALGDFAERFEGTEGAVASVGATKGKGKALQPSASPLVSATVPQFASAAFTAASQISHHGEHLSFHVLRRYNRLATTSLLRQSQSFHIDAPVFGVLLRGNLVAFHVDWYEECDGVVVSNSAFYPLNDEETDLKTWDLRQSAEAHEVTTILANLREYTSGLYASRVRKGLQSVKEPIKPWKWDSSRLPEVLAYTQVQQHVEEPVQAKIDRWQESIESSGAHEPSGGWLRRKWEAERLEFNDFLSPPSTPQSPENLHTGS